MNGDEKKKVIMEQRKLGVPSETWGAAAVYLTRDEAAQYLNIPPSWLANNAKRGPRYIKIGGLVRYSVAALDQYMSAHERRR